MPPKPSKRPSLFAAWAKQEAEAKAREEKKRPFEQGEVVSLTDIEDVKETEMWPVFNPDNTHGRPQSPPKLKIEYTPQEILKEKGYDAAAGDSIIYPSGEVIRPYELSILKTCLSVNTSVCLPGSVCPIHIVVLTFLNFKRWFPNGYFIFCSNESPDNFKSSCIVNGIDEKEITVCATFNAFKQKKAENFSPFIVCTPQTMQKIVETDNPIILRIRCIAVCMDSGEQSQKYARFVGPLVGKGNLFRLLITTPSRPSKSHKIAPISTRQKTITSMFITEWEEPSATNGLFRRAVVPSKIEPLMWTNDDLTPDAVELLASWKEGAEVILNEFSNSVPLPSKNIEDLLNIEWVELLAEADALQFGIKCLICTFLTTAYRHLLLNGARVFYLFCSDFLNNAPHSDDIQMCILGSPPLSKVLEKVEADYSYNNAPIYNQSPSIQSMNSHVKYQKLVEKVQSYMKNENPIRGVILCESLQLSRTVCESLSFIPDLKVVLGVPSSAEILPEHQTTTRRFNSMTGLFYENKNTVALMSFESNDDTVFHALDTAISNELHFIIAMGRKSLCMVEYHKKKYYVFLNDTYEPLRKLDSKIVQEADELTDREVNNMVTGAVGSVNKYAFKFEQSNLAIDVRKKKMRFVKFAEGQLMLPPDLTRRGKRAHARDDNDGEEMPNSVEKRKRGRPRNSTVIDTTANIEPEAEDFTPIRPISASSEKSVNDGDKINDTVEKRKRGKPRKLAAAKETIETGESTSSNQPVVFTNSSPSNPVVDKEKTLKNPKESPEKKKQRGRPRRSVAVKEFRNDTPAVATSQALEIREDVSPIETDVPSEAMMDPVALARVRKLDEVMEKLDRILLMKLPPRSI